MDLHANDATALLRSIDTKLAVLLSLAIADRLPEASRASKRSLDGVLHAAGLSQNEIASLMGKSRQAVQQVLKTEADGRKPAKRNRTGTKSRRSGVANGGGS
jgi:hypothetical protein